MFGSPCLVMILLESNPETSTLRIKPRKNNFMLCILVSITISGVPRNFIGGEAKFSHFFKSIFLAE